MKELFYLVYNLKNSNINWIVDVDYELNNDFIKAIDIISKHEIYKLYSRYVSIKSFDSELKYKQFRKFIIKKNDKLLYESLLN
jgi:hypothetical protein